MDKKILEVPEGIRFISNWKDYNLDDYQYPHILNKVLTGCGFTEYCIKNPMNVILLSPRKMLLENKESQHQGEVFYAKNEVENTIDFERDISVPHKASFTKKNKNIDPMSILEYHDRIKKYVLNCISNQKPCKILVTYDSFRHVKKVLKDLDILDRFYTVVDEFQSFLIDSRFKTNTELEVLYQLQDIQKVCFVSATPLLDKYLDLLDEFKNLPYFELDWETKEPGRVKKPLLDIRITKRGLNEEIKSVINQYLENRFDKRLYRNESGNPFEIESREAVIFVNSVKSIARAIINCKLTPDNTNVLCARTDENEKVIKAAFNQSLEKQKLSKLPRGTKIIGSIPCKGEPHKMFTFCTRTVYLGADFYSTCAKTFIFSDSNAECLAVDISMDLEQILGRQRLNENPWKDYAYLVIKTTRDRITKEEFDRILQKKIETSKNLLGIYENADPLKRHNLAENFEKVAKSYNYKDDYVAVNRHGGKDLVPVFNNLVLVSDQRAFDIQQIDYKNRFTVFNSVSSKFSYTSDKINEYLNKFNSLSTFPDKMRYLQDVVIILTGSPELDVFLDQIPRRMRDYYEVFGFERMKALEYSESYIKKEWERLVSNSLIEEKLISRIYEEFQEGSGYSNTYIKNKFREIYDELGYQEAPKATNILNYFDVKSIKISTDSGKRENGFKLLKKKE